MAGVIDAPKITESEIEDRSKGDAISKTGRHSSDDMVYCSVYRAMVNQYSSHGIGDLNIGLCNAERNHPTVLWWHKPQNVGVPVYLEIKATPPNSPRQ